MPTRDRRTAAAISPELLLAAYANGLFPMARSAKSHSVDWVDPEWRGVIPLESLHVPSRLGRTIRTTTLTVATDMAFEDVMRACAAPVRGRPDTWINQQILEAYCRLFALGHAHSVEVRRDGELVGGLYGVKIGAAFFGESMFSRERDASKIALVHLVARLRRGGFRLLDAQFVTEHLRQFGIQEIPRADYHLRLKAAIGGEANFYELGPAGAAVSGLAALHETTQTS
jgi:leucyl/phenylalanyl-tRNA---protein transferase